jgi:hypothetical protein
MIEYKRKDFLSDNEKAFFYNLESIACEEYYIFSKVKILDLVSVEGLEGEDLWRHPIWTKHVDFVICDREVVPLLVIELNGPEHKTEYNSIKGGFAKENIFKVINLPLVTIENERINDLPYITTVLSEHLDQLS